MLKKVIIVCAVLILGLPAAGILVAWSGIFNVAATQGHSAAVAWFLHFTMKNSVRAHARHIEVPEDIASQTRVRRGAGHYALGCASCHGAPGNTRNPIVKQMVPPPPPLVEHVADWKARELFWIVKHGIKYAGMPAWPAQNRDDEVWDVIGFLQKLPEMSGNQYLDLVGRDGKPEQSENTKQSRTSDPAVPLVQLASHRSQTPAQTPAVQTCARCHGLDGLGGAGGSFPRIAGHPEGFLRATIMDYAEHRRSSGIMMPVAAQLSDSQISQLAAFYATQPRKGAGAALEKTSPNIQLGENLALHGDPANDIPKCNSCHGRVHVISQQDGSSSKSIFPELRGQNADFLKRQLGLFRDGRRGGARANVMRLIADRLSDKQVEALAAYYAQASINPE